ncbi:MAG TPA: hypothetical protein VGR79_04490 [Stellaceae bacterium]|nr:hypothetical protein [Stellaceae bacterium]
MGSSERDVARSRAQTLFGKERTKERTKDEEFRQARDKERQEEAAKMARLRALRLAKEKEEKEEADRKAATAVARRKPAL